jgi:hypothetical protein
VVIIPDAASAQRSAFKSFNAGEKVTFSGTEWYVIKDTGIDEKEVELIIQLLLWSIYINFIEFE